MFGIFYNVAVFVVIISIVVFVHEFGHYYVARLCGIRATDFSIGFGKKICGFKDKYGTEWKISMIPLGGYVKFLGDADFASASKKDGAVPAHLKKYAFATQNLFKKSLVVVAGPMANFVFAILIFASFYMYFGRVVVSTEVSFVESGSVAEEAGLKKGDVITEVDGNKVDRFSDIEMYVSTHPNISLALTFERSGVQKNIKITPRAIKIKDKFGDQIEIGKLGVGAQKFRQEKYGLFGAISEAYKESLKITSISLKAIGQMITGERGTKDLGSVIRISKYAGKSARQGMMVLVWFTAMISLNLGLVNLFPIPPLDGGHLFLYISRFCLGKKIASYIEKWLLKIGIVIIVLLMVFSIINDIVHV